MPTAEGPALTDKDAGDKVTAAVEFVERRADRLGGGCIDRVAHVRPVQPKHQDAALRCYEHLITCGRFRWSAHRGAIRRAP